MKPVSTLALAAVLALGMAAQPATAQKKSAPEAVKGPVLSAAFRKAAGPVQEAIKALNYPDATVKLAAAETAATTPDEKFINAQFRYQIATAQKDVAGQAIGIQAMLNSGGAPASVMPQLTLAAGNAAYQKGDYQGALRFLSQAQQAGNSSTDVQLLLAETNFKLNQIPAGLASVDRAIATSKAAGTKPPEAWYARAASVAYKGKLMAEASRWTRDQVREYPTAQNWRSALVIYRDSGQRDGQLNLDLYRLMRITKALDGERDYFEYAALASERGLPGETKAVIDEGRASGKLPAGSRAIGELATAASAKTTSDRASLATSERQANGSSTGRIAANTADAYLGYGDYPKAIALYRVALTKSGVDMDAVNTRLGIALARSGDKEGARGAFAAVKGARQEIAQFWLLWLDTPAVA